MDIQLESVVSHRATATGCINIIAVIYETQFENEQQQFQVWGLHTQAHRQSHKLVAFKVLLSLIRSAVREESGGKPHNWHDSPKCLSCGYDKS